MTTKNAAGDQRMPDKCQFGAVVVPRPVIIDRAAFNQVENAQYKPHIEEADVMDSLVARGPHAVGVPYRKSKRAQSDKDYETWVDDGKANTINVFDSGDTRTTHAVVSEYSMAVRRLTPVECERLQGFPDNWTRISWKGAPEEECPDGHRYKACGNSMAVPCMAWIGKRIAEYESRSNGSV